MKTYYIVYMSNDFVVRVSHGTDHGEFVAIRDEMQALIDATEDAQPYSQAIIPGTNQQFNGIQTYEAKV